MDDYRVIIAGSRSFNNYTLLREKCNEYLRNKRNTHHVIIVSGGARGADSLGEQYAQDEGFALERYLAQWDVYGRSAGFRRNEQMAEIADALIAFWDGESHGTKHMIDIMNEKELQVKVVQYNDSSK